jgi:hypothetical protein
MSASARRQIGAQGHAERAAQRPPMAKNPEIDAPTSWRETWRHQVALFTHFRHLPKVCASRRIGFGADVVASSELAMGDSAGSVTACLIEPDTPNHAPKARLLLARVATMQPVNTMLSPAFRAQPGCRPRLATAPLCARHTRP